MAFCVGRGCSAHSAAHRPRFWLERSLRRTGGRACHQTELMIFCLHEAMRRFNARQRERAQEICFGGTPAAARVTRLKSTRTAAQQRTILEHCLCIVVGCASDAIGGLAPLQATKRRQDACAHSMAPKGGAKTKNKGAASRAKNNKKEDASPPAPKKGGKREKRAHSQHLGDAVRLSFFVLAGVSTQVIPPARSQLDAGALAKGERTRWC